MNCSDNTLVHMYKEYRAPCQIVHLRPLVVMIYTAVSRYGRFPLQWRGTLWSDGCGISKGVARNFSLGGSTTHQVFHMTTQA